MKEYLIPQTSEECISTMVHSLNFGFSSPWDEYEWNPVKALDKAKAGSLICTSTKVICCLGVVVKCLTYKAYSKDINSSYSDLVKSKEEGLFVSQEAINTVTEELKNANYHPLYRRYVEGHSEVLEVVGYYYKEDMDPDSVWKHEAKYFDSLFPNVTDSLSAYGFYND